MRIPYNLRFCVKNNDTLYVVFAQNEKQNLERYPGIAPIENSTLVELQNIGQNYILSQVHLNQQNWTEGHNKD